MDSKIRPLPKAELHVHIEGTVTPEMARKKAASHGMVLPDDIFSEDGKRFAWADFLDCVTRVYDAVASTIRTKQDFTDITYDYLKRCAQENAIYVEVIASPDHCERLGLSYKDMIDGMVDGIDKANKETGIEARINTTLVRHLPMSDVKKSADTIISYPHPYIVGLNLAGGEKEGDIPQFAPIIEEIRKKVPSIVGFGPHASEAAGPKNILDAINLNPTRIGHGVRAIEDPKAIKAVIDNNIVLEVCIDSNRLAGIYPDYKSHPLRDLINQGVRVTLNSDDPGLFGNSIGTEYQIAKDHFGLNENQLLQITRTAIEAAYVDAGVKQRLMKKVNDYDFLLRNNQKRLGPTNGLQP